MTRESKSRDSKARDSKKGAPTSDELVKRRRIIAAGLLALGALALWASSRLVWARIEGEDNLSPQQSFDALGSDWSPWLTPLALVLLAALAAAFTLRGWGLRILALVLALAGVIASLPALSLLTEGGDSDYAAQVAEVPARFQILIVDTQTLPALVVLLGTAATVAGSIFLLRAASGRQGVASKYQTPAVRREAAEQEIFAEHERRKAAAGGAGGGANSDAAPGDSESGGDSTGGVGTQDDGDIQAGGVAEGGDADGVDTDGVDTDQRSSAEDSVHDNERILWDALDTGIDPTDDLRPDGRQK